MTARRHPRAAFATALAIFACDALAGALHVGPTRVELTKASPVAVIDVRNDNPDPIIVQIEHAAWTQEAGGELYVPTQELIATPRVFRLPGGAAQTLRVGVRDWRQIDTERAFRVYVREVPVAGNASGPGPGLQVALRIGVPVFVSAEEATPRLGFRIASLPNGQLTLVARNDGGHWARIARMEARAPDDGSSVWRMTQPGYLLAGGYREWTASPSRAVHGGDRLHLIVTTDGGEQETMLEVAE